MVEDRITDGKRIAQLLASELTGLQTGPLADVELTDSDPEAIPSDSGTVAYRIQYEGEQVGTVLLYPAYVELELQEADTVQITHGAAVKQAVDLFRAALE